MSNNKMVFTGSEQLIHNYKNDKVIPQIVTDFDDNDFYKFNMLYFFFKKHPNAVTEWKFFNRGNHKFPVGFDIELKKQIKGWEKMRFTDEMEIFLKSKAVGKDGKCYYDESFFTFLRGMRFDATDIQVIQTANNLDITISGLQYKIMLYEVMVMCTIVELRNIMSNYIPTETLEELNRNDISKFMLFDKVGATVADFGTRRRYSKANQERMLQQMINYNCCVGTSNVALARKYDLTPIGTSAHEIIMFLATKFGTLSANSQYLGQWTEVFGGNLGIALTDTYTTENFLKSFDSLHLKTFDGVRHDSGEPLAFADRIVKHYKENGIDPMTKTIVFSDGISNMETVKELLIHCKGKINISFGIGTWLTNDLADIPSMNIVVKMSRSLPANRKEWLFTVKISDNPIKVTSIDARTVEHYRYELGITA